MKIVGSFMFAKILHLLKPISIYSSTMTMLVYIKQHLSNVWNSIHEEVKNAGRAEKKGCLYKSLYFRKSAPSLIFFGILNTTPLAGYLIIHCFIFVAMVWDSCCCLHRNHPFNTYVTFCGKLTFPTPWCTHVRVCIRG